MGPSRRTANCETLFHVLNSFSASSEIARLLREPEHTIPDITPSGTLTSVKMCCPDNDSSSYTLHKPTAVALKLISVFELKTPEPLTPMYHLGATVG